MHRRVEIVQGSHDDPAVLSRAPDAAAGLFWLVPLGLAGTSTEERSRNSAADLIASAPMRWPR